MSNNKDIKALQYSDAELCRFLLENNKADTYENLQILKKGLLEGKITICEEDETDSNLQFLANDEKEAIEGYDKIIDKVDDKGLKDQLEHIKDEEKNHYDFLKKAQDDKDAKYEHDDEKKEDVVESIPAFTRETQLFLNRKATERMLESFLVEECGMKKLEYAQLNESMKGESLKEVATLLLDSVREKLSSIDTTPADKSRGDIKQLKELSSIQDALDKLSAILERDENTLPEYTSALNTIIKSLLYINQYSNVFKDAYRNKKTLMIMKYQSLILSIISSITYLISSILDYSAGSVTLKQNVKDIQNFAPLKALYNFVKSVDTGEFKMITNDVAVLREFYLELSVEQMGQLLEAVEYGPMVIDGIKSIYSSLVSGNTKVSNLLYRVAGIFVLLMSLRDVFYTLFRMKSKVFDMLNAIKNFISINDGGNTISKLLPFSNKYKDDADFASDLTRREVEDENRALLTKVRTIQQNEPKEEVIDAEPAVEVQAAPKPAPKPAASASANTDWGFDF